LATHITNGAIPTSAYQTNTTAHGTPDQSKGPHAPGYFWDGGPESAGQDGAAEPIPMPSAVVTALEAEGYTLA
jgi:hypothetical protein